MAMSILIIDGLNKRFGGLIATKDVSLAIEEGECHALIGPNGAGKTTLISLLMGDLTPDSGSILLCGKQIDGMPGHERVRAGIARSYQVTNLVQQRSVRDNMLVALIGKQGNGFGLLRPLVREAALLDEAFRRLNSFGLAARAHDLVANLSYGEQRSLELALAFASDPAVLLLDEPMAGLGHEETIAMTNLLSQFRRRATMILVEHDMNAVFALADRVTVLVSGAILKTGSPDEVRADARVRDVYLGNED
jgi:branched-chain amino acid transport system ATP-binding protein